MKLIRYLQSILIIVFVTAASRAQEGSIRGKVVDQNTKEPIPMVRPRQFLPRIGADIVPKKATSPYGFARYVIDIRTKF